MAVEKKVVDLALPENQESDEKDYQDLYFVTAIPSGGASKELFRSFGETNPLCPTEKPQRDFFVFHADVFIKAVGGTTPRTIIRDISDPFEVHFVLSDLTSTKSFFSLPMSDFFSNGKGTIRVFAKSFMPPELIALLESIAITNPSIKLIGFKAIKSFLT